MKTVTRYAWVPALTASLAISTYSLYWVARAWGMPPVLASLVSMIFDFASLTFADLSLRIARTHGDSALMPRTAVILLAAGSAWLNSYHPLLAGHTAIAARLLYAAPPVITVWLFEAHMRYERRSALRRAGRVPASLPAFGRWPWLLFPFRTLRALRSVVAFRLETVATANGIVVEAAAGNRNDAGNRQGSGDSPAIRAWARSRGIAVNTKGPVAASVRNAYELENSHPELSDISGYL